MRSGSPSAAGVDGNAAAHGSAGAGPCFEVLVKSVSGEGVRVSGLHPQQAVKELYEKVTSALGFKAHEVLLCAGTRLIKEDQLESSLEDAGICEGVDLTFVRRRLVHSTNVGVSRYNGNYFCTVSRVEEVGWGELEVAFEVVGNMSLGNIQDPARSQIQTWPEGATSWEGQQTHLPSGVRYEKNDRSRCVRGVLLYRDVPMGGGAVFTFGTYGYSDLVLLRAGDSAAAVEAGAAGTVAAAEAPAAEAEVPVAEAEVPDLNPRGHRECNLS